MKALKTAALELQKWLGGFKGVFDLSDDLRPGKPEVRIHLKEGATAVGLNARTIAEQLRAAFHGTDAYEIQVGAESYEINVALSAFDRNSIWDLENFRITLTDGTQIPIGSVAILSLDRGGLPESPVWTAGGQ